MLNETLKNEFAALVEDLKEQGLYKNERIIQSPQEAWITVGSNQKVLNLCSNNYLGLAHNIRVAEAAKKAIDEWGYGLSSVRFICGTQGIHKELENRVSSFLKTDDTLLYAACFDANGGIFEPLLQAQDAIISDALNHASIIDGVRLCKAERYKYSHSNMDELEKCLQLAQKHHTRLICTDGVFSMDGDIAKLGEICDLAEQYDALVMVDDSHATGYIGAHGRGTPEHCGVEGRIDLITTTFGKALGGANGGCTSGRKELIDLLRQRSRPYLFSNTLAPGIAGATLEVLTMLEESPELRNKTMKSAVWFRTEMEKLGFDVVPGDTAIIPVMLYEERLAVAMAERLLQEGVYVIGFSFPVVPKGKARIRTQISAAHTLEDLAMAVRAFKKVGKEFGII